MGGVEGGVQGHGGIAHLRPDALHEAAAGRLLLPGSQHGLRFEHNLQQSWMLRQGRPLPGCRLPARAAWN